MRYLQLFTANAFFALLFAQCARPCPNDVVLGTLSTSQYTSSFVPASQDVSNMTFVRTDGSQLLFTASVSGNQPSEIPVETLCQRGDYLDKTSQVSLFKTTSKRYSYAANNSAYTLEIQADIENLGTYGSPKDTVFIEKFVTWGQKTTQPVRVGVMSVLTNERGNGAKISDTLRQQYNRFHIVADTTLNGRQIKNAYVTVNDGAQSMFIFYTKEKGIEAFTTDTEVWTRQ